MAMLQRPCIGKSTAKSNKNSRNTWHIEHRAAVIAPRSWLSLTNFGFFSRKGNFTHAFGTPSGVIKRHCAARVETTLRHPVLCPTIPRNCVASPSCRVAICFFAFLFNVMEKQKHLLFFAKLAIINTVKFGPYVTAAYSIQRRTLNMILKNKIDIRLTQT